MHDDELADGARDLRQVEGAGMRGLVKQQHSAEVVDDPRPFRQSFGTDPASELDQFRSSASSSSIWAAVKVCQSLGCQPGKRSMLSH